MANFSKEAQAIYDAADYHNGSNDPTEFIVAGALRAAALQFYTDWDGMTCAYHLYAIANEFDPLS